MVEDFFNSLYCTIFLYLGQHPDRLSTHQVDHQCIIIELLSTAKNISRGWDLHFKIDENLLIYNSSFTFSTENLKQTFDLHRTQSKSIQNISYYSLKIIN